MMFFRVAILELCTMNPFWQYIFRLRARQRPVFRGPPVVSGGAVKSLWRVAQRGGLGVCNDSLFEGEVNRDLILCENLIALLD